jgi:hypothetical protein
MRQPPPPAHHPPKTFAGADFSCEFRSVTEELFVLATTCYRSRVKATDDDFDDLANDPGAWRSAAIELLLSRDF